MERIIDLGVRAFDKAETADKGKPLNLARREARLSRRRLRRRAQRLTELTRALCRFGVIENRNFFRVPQPRAVSPWLLRKEGLERLLRADEWARVIYHLCKHRGFYWGNRAGERSEADSGVEAGRLRRGLAATAALMNEKGYRSAAEMVLSEFPESQRNKRGDYGKALSRRLLGKEFSLLFERQREFGNPFASAALETLILGHGDCRSGLFWRQKAALCGEDLLRMIGKCTFEHGEYHAPKAAFTAERHVWLTRLNNLRIFVAGHQRPLSGDELRMALPLPYQHQGVLTYKQLRSALTDAGLLREPFVFAGLPDTGTSADAESAALVALPAWQTIRSALTKAGLEAEWRQMAGAALRGDPALLDNIAWVLSVYKDDGEVARELAGLMLPGGEKAVDALLGVRFDKFHALSLKALCRIVPHMEQGMRFDQACERAGYHHSRPHGGGACKYLPPFYRGRDRQGRLLFADGTDTPRNPVVLRALNQARKVVNAVVKRYGAPLRVHIEMARDLSRPFEERQRIVTAQNAYREQSDQDKVRFAEYFGRVPSGREFEKWRLYREQQGKCVYSLDPLDPRRLLDDGYVEIDHILPYSRSFDDSKNNRALALVKENRDKGNLTPFEYLGGANDSPRWRRFAAFVSDNKGYRQAKRQRLLRRDFSDAEACGFRERNLNDTRYICRFFKRYVERHLRLAENSDVGRCVVVSGQLTSFLRARWGLLKVRDDSDRHHALDAAVVAVCSRAMVKHLADYARCRELEDVRDGFIDPTSGEIVDAWNARRRREPFPQPWPHFRQELETRLRMNDPARLNEELIQLGSYPAEALRAAHPLFVSRAPQRRNGGAAHKETVYARPARFAGSGSVTQKIPLSRLRLKDMDRLIDPERNVKLYAAIRARLEAHGGSGEKAFPPGSELRKPDRNGNPTGPLVRSVTAVINKLSGIPVRGGIAENGNMLRVDVFSKAARFYLVPVYVHHKVCGLPDRAVAAGKHETEWPRIDGSYTWCFSLYPNDLVRVTSRRESVFGYYAGCDRATGAISIWAHDRDRRVGKNGLIRGIGVKTALALEKFDVDVLGRIYPARPEIRRRRA